MNVGAMQVSIPDEALVLDVGSGHEPHPRANVLVDLYPDAEHDIEQRGGGAMVQDARSFIAADLCAGLPFPDHHFDFVICAETLNHVPDADAACRELVRVAKAGYIEVANCRLEIFHPHSEHLWRCWQADNVLHFARKRHDDDLAKAENVIGWATCFSDLPQRQYYLDLIHANWFLFFVTLAWEGSFRWEIHE